MFSPQDEIWDYLGTASTSTACARTSATTPRSPVPRMTRTTTSWQVEVNGSELVDTRILVSGVGALADAEASRPPGRRDLRRARPSTPRGGATTRPHRAQRRRHRHRRQRHPVRAADRARGRAARPLPALRSLGHPEAQPADQSRPSRPPTHAIPLRQRAMRAAVYWALEARGAGFALTPKAMKLLEKQARRHLHKQVADPELRAKLEPDYQIGCKRILLSNDFYPALTRDNVDVVTDAIAEVTAARASSTRTASSDPTDTIIFGTGFEISGNLTQMKVVGRRGAVLNDVWDRDGIGAHLGMTRGRLPQPVPAARPQHRARAQLGGLHDRVADLATSSRRSTCSTSTAPAAMEVRADAQQGFLDRDPEPARGHGLAVGLQELVPRRERAQLHHLAALHLEVLVGDPQARPDRRISCRVRASAQDRSRFVTLCDGFHRWRVPVGTD